MLFERGVNGEGVPEDLPESEVSSGVAGGDMTSVEANTPRLLWIAAAVRKRFGPPVVVK